jgi:hypothetical protein
LNLIISLRNASNETTIAKEQDRFCPKYAESNTTAKKWEECGDIETRSGFRGYQKVKEFWGWIINLSRRKKASAHHQYTFWALGLFRFSDFKVAKKSSRDCHHFRHGYKKYKTIFEALFYLILYIAVERVAARQHIEMVNLVFEAMLQSNFDNECGQEDSDLSSPAVHIFLYFIQVMLIKLLKEFILYNLIIPRGKKTGL